MKKKKVLVAVSGGVDSAVAAKLLIDQGFDVAGIFLNFWKEEGGASENKCCSLEAQMDAKNVCLDLGIPFYTYDFSKKFKEEVVDNFLSEYGAGRTPNPCVVCNKKIKIGGLIEYSLSLGFDYLATGHYCLVKESGGEYSLLKGKDNNKDQSYFLYTLSQKHLSHLIFPLGDLKKDKVRKIAREAGLVIANKSESQEICFISGKRHNDFLKKHLKLKSGDIRILNSNELIGSHQGLPLYTIGQRRGIDVGGTGPYYVADFDYSKNILYVVEEFNDDFLYKKEMFLESVNFIEKVNAPFKSKVVIRYRHDPVSCQVELSEDNNSLYKVTFLKKQRAVTSGQSAVFYKGRKVLGGGIIL